VATSNPALSDAAFEKARQASATQAGWAAPTGYPPPQAPDEVSPWQPGPPVDLDVERMTVNGTVTATGVLLVLLVFSAVIGWNAVEADAFTVEFPGWLFIPMIVGFGAAIASCFKPLWARFLGPIYALSMGAVVGAISRLYEFQFDGIVFQAAVGTVGVLGIMLFLYATRIVKVTDKLRMGIIMATGAIALVYLVNFVLRLFGTEVPFLHDTGAIGIGISVVIVAVAAMNLLLDFDFVERGTAAGLPKTYEWYAAFGLLLTLVWLYLELLRLLSKLQRN
jgi:uncharacterized YccA/Bax inhibitor family protein